MRAQVLFGRQAIGAWGAPLVLFAAYALAMALLFLSGVIDFRNARDLEGSVSNVSRTLEALEKLRTLGNTFFIAESSQRGYVLTGNADYLAPYAQMKDLMPKRMADVTRIVADTPSQAAAVARLRELGNAQFADMDRTLDLYRQEGPDAAVKRIAHDNGLATMTALRNTIRDMLAEESQLLAARRVIAASEYSRGLTRGTIATSIVALALTAFFLLMYRFLRQRDAAVRAIEATNAELEQRVRDRTVDLSHLSHHLISVREHEKKILARDLHDDFGSYLTAINMDVSRVRQKIAATHPDLAQKLDRTLGLLTSAIGLKRQLISDLRPSILDNLGLGPALEQYVEEWSLRTGISATFDFDGALESNDEGCPIAIFRVFQEALANVEKHANAKRVSSYAYRVADAIDFEIADDGVGITEAERSKPATHGLLGIRERVLAYRGRFEILNGPQGGTVLRATMPCNIPPADTAATSFTMQFA